MFEAPLRSAMFGTNGERTYWPDGMTRASCNCAQCGQLMVSTPSGTDVAGRVNGRPFCKRCLPIVTDNQLLRR
jgi:hypothetical protein